MKRVEVNREITETVVDVFYEALDGTRFISESECRKYEESALGVLLGKMSKFSINNEIESEWFDCNDENKYKCVLPATEEHIDILNQIWKCFSGSNKDDLKFSQSDINTPVLVGYRFCCSYELDSVWFVKLVDEIANITDNRFTIKRC